VSGWTRGCEDGVWHVTRGRATGAVWSATLAGVLLLLAGAAAPSRAALPGANGIIAFVSSRDGNDEIYTMRSDGREQTNVTKNAATEQDPAWDPTGRLLAYTRYGSSGGAIWIQQIGDKARNDVPLTSNPEQFPGAGGGTGNVIDQGPTWSPLGIPPAIAFESSKGGLSEIYTGDFNPTVFHLARLTSNGASSDRQPAWSPQGDKIAFWSARDQNREIYVMGADGSSQTNLTRSPLSDREPSWSPDGKKIAFWRTLDGGNDEIFVMNADGSGVENLTGNPGDDKEPAWSPDGESIAFVSDRDGNDEIYTMKADGTAQTRVTTNTAADRQPDWQPIPQTTGLGVLRMSKADKDDWVKSTRKNFFTSVGMCGIALIPAVREAFGGLALKGCQGLIAGLVAAGVVLVVDPPDSRYNQVFMPQPFPAPTVTNQVCKAVRSGSPCSRLKVALLGYFTAEARVGSITEATAITANRARNAESAGSKSGIAIQQAAVRTYWGAYSFALKDRAAAAKRLSREFLRAKFDVSITPAQQTEGVSALTALTSVPAAEPVVKRFMANGFSREDVRSALAAALKLVPQPTGNVSLRALLLENTSTRGLDADYKKMTLGDVGAVVDSFSSQGIVSRSLASTLRTSLARAQSVSRRRTEMRKFVATVAQRLKRQPHSAFLQVTAAPLAGLNQGIAKGTPARVTKTQAIASVRAILNRNAKRCRLTVLSLTARSTSSGWQVTAVVTIRGGTPGAASWNVVGKKIAAADPLAADIAAGCP
jgi:Tol biopolymer transport system component